jgi:transposase
MSTKQRDHGAMEQRRRRAAKLFEEGVSPAEVGRRVGVSKQAAHSWKQAWESGGLQALASKGAAGPKARLSARHIERLRAALVAGPAKQGYRTDLWTCGRVGLLIRELTGVKYHPGHVWKLLGALGFSCQRPTRRAVERDERAIRRWKRMEWPAIKKKPGANAAPSSSSTKQA